MVKAANILVVDDEPSIRETFAVVFGSSHVLRLVASAEEALATPHAAALEVGTVFLDGQLGPGLSGDRALPLIRQRFPAARIVFTGALGAQQAAALRAAGAYAVLPKPWALSDLVATVDGDPSPN
jgi:DNA-binding NtrC family response regulator